MIFLGIDAGTQGVRATAVTENGKLIASAHKQYEHFNLAPANLVGLGYKEQSPADWWNTCRQVLIDIGRELSKENVPVTAVCIDGTSGTILPLDINNEPLGNAIMYNDVRGNGGKALPKVLWCREHGAGPDHRQAARFIHHADYIAGKLTGEYGITDWSNALKSGYDVEEEKWTDEAIAAFAAGIQKVVAPGTEICEVRTDDPELRYLNGAKLVAGASDGYMSAIATCAVNPGEFASIIGTTLILKGVTKRHIVDPEGVVYCHKHPQGYWMPGGASNVGGRCLNEWFGEENFDYYNEDISWQTPTGLLEYPLLVKGERFPFMAPDFAGFGSHMSYTAVIEGISYVERMCIEAMDDLGPAAFEFGYDNCGLKIIGRPSISDVDLSDEKVLTYTFAVELYPEVTLGQYKGLEAEKQMEMAGEYPDIIVACFGGGSNFGGIAFPFMRHNFSGERHTRFVAAEPESCPKLTKGVFQYDFGDEAGYTPMIPMLTLGHEFMPANIHAGGLRYHGAGAIVTQLLNNLTAMLEAIDKALHPHRGE